VSAESALVLVLVSDETYEETVKSERQKQRMEGEGREREREREGEGRYHV